MLPAIIGSFKRPNNRRSFTDPVACQRDRALRCLQPTSSPKGQACVFRRVMQMALLVIRPPAHRLRPRGTGDRKLTIPRILALNPPDFIWRSSA